MILIFITDQIAVWHVLIERTVAEWLKGPCGITSGWEGQRGVDASASGHEGLSVTGAFLFTSNIRP